ncbi:MAG: hypothetical protein H6780_02145 [Candidatus Nomurabacteria bacterium]|nr:MAG: hypothetical protein H6780_02145 [Candidatus Nomurabacteria bacterium]
MQTKTLSGRQFYSAVACIFVLGIMAVTGPTMYAAGKLAWVTETEAVLTTNVGSMTCNTVEYHRYDKSFIYVTGHGGTRDNTSGYVGGAFYDTTHFPSVTSITSHSWGAITSAFGAVDDPRNVVASACENRPGLQKP